VSASASVKTTARGQAKHQSSTTTSTSAAGNATGVKSSSTTGFNASAPAGSSATKLYGNGRTAGQIAEQNGASASTMLFGPGNSQPHKATLCSGNGKAHLVDVHALRVHGAGACLAASTLSSGSTTSSSSGTAGGSVTALSPGKGFGAKAGARIKVRASNRSGGVLGARHSVSAEAKPAHAVLGSANFTG